MTKRALIYARVSSSGDRQSTDRQVEDLTEYAAASGMEIVRIFSEKVSGARRNGDRPVLTEALDFATDQTNSIDMVLVSEMSRLGRNVYEIQETIKRLVDARVNLYMQKERLTLLDESGAPSVMTPVMISVLGVCAQLERESIAFRLNSGRKRYVESGGRLGRRKGTGKTPERLLSDYPKVVRCLNKGQSVRDTAKICGVGTTTVMKVRRAMGTTTGKKMSPSVT